MSLFLCLNCISPVFVYAENNDVQKGKLIFKYYDVNQDRYLDADDTLEIGNYYEVQLWINDMDVESGCIPIHYNNEVLQLVSANNVIIENNIIGQYMLDDEDEVIQLNYDDYEGIWIPVQNDTTPRIDINNGLVFFQFMWSSPGGVEIKKEKKVFSLKFLAINTGDTELRVSDNENDPDLWEDDEFGGAEFSSYEVMLIPFDIINESKVVPRKVTSVNIEQDNIEVGIGNTSQLTAVVSPADAYNKSVTWKSEDENIAKVDENGIVTGVSEGEVKITVTTKDGGFIDTCTVKVINENIPTTPTNLKVVSKTGKTVTFKWSESTAKNGVSGYNVYRNGVKIATVTECTYTDSDESLTQGVEYSYTVEAFYNDTEDVLTSEMSKVLKVTLANPKITSVTPVSQSVMGITKQQTVYVYYKNDNNSEGTTLNVEYQVDGSYVPVTAEQISEIKSGVNNDGTLNYFTFTMLPESLTTSDVLNLRFTVTDKSGSKDVKEVTYALVNSPAPVVLEGEAQPNTVVLSWGVAESAYVTKYTVYRRLSGSDTWIRYKYIDGRDNTFFIDDTVSEATKYDYYVTATDKFGQESIASNYIEEIVPGTDIEPPVVMTISPNNESILSKTATISAVVEDSKGVEKVQLEYRTSDQGEWIIVETIQNPQNSNVKFSIDTTEISAEKIQVRVMAVDVDGNVSDGQPIRTYFIDNTPPKKVSPVSGNADSETKVTLSWKEYDEDKDFYYFTVEQKYADGTYKPIGDKIYDVKGMQVKDLVPEKEYTFRVFAYDKAGNRSEPSDDCTVSTLADITAPYITKITPDPKKINEDLKISFTAKDNYAVGGILVQTSYDEGEEKTWTDRADIPATVLSQTVTLSYTLKISEHKDGSVFVRAIPYDMAGNSDETKAPYHEYVIDTTAPTVPEILETSGINGVVRIGLVPHIGATETITYTYKRAESENGPYTVIKENHQGIVFNDYDVKEGKTYYYQVCAIDDMGNVSDYSEPFSVTVEQDKTKPEIDGILPSDGARINKTSSIEVYAYDNISVKNITLQYSEDGDTWKEVGKKTGDVATFPLISLNLSEGKYKFRAYAEDNSGNVGEKSKVYEYIVDNTAPVISNVLAEGGEECIDLSFNCEPYEDLRGITIYYKTQNSGYKVASTRAPSASNSYSCTIAGLSANEEYTIKIVAEDLAGNTAEYIVGSGTSGGNGGSIVVKPVPVVVVLPEIEINGPTTVVAGIENIFKAVKTKGTYDIDSYEWSFGDGATAKVREVAHKFTKTGTYVVNCTVTDTEGNSYTATKKVIVNEPEEVATLKINIVDDKGNVVPDAEILFDVGSTDKGHQNLKYTSLANGTCIITAEPGTYEVGVYKDGYLPAQKAVSLVKNATIELDIRIVEKCIVIGSLTWERMTFKEIEEAGIDTTDPANTNLFKYEMTVYIGDEEISFKGHKSIDDDSPIVVTDKDFTSNKRITDGSGKLVNNTIYIYDFNDKENGYSYDSESDILEAPKTLVAYVQTPGEISWLKEFFNVTLTVTNQAEERFWLTDCHASLNFPTSGLTLISDNNDVEMGSDIELSGKVYKNVIKGQQTAEAKWILRGDVAGEYDISADFDGKLGSITNGEFDSWNRDIKINFESERPIKVYGSEGLSLVVEYEDGLDITNDYMFRLGIRNRSVLTRYLPNVTISENDKITAVKEYQNYKELISGTRLESEAETLEYGETVYSNFTVDGLTHDDDIAGIVIRRLPESVVNLPREYKKVKPLTFHERKIDIYTIDEEGNEIEDDAHALSAYPGTKIKLGIHLTELLPGDGEYTDCEGVSIYLDNQKIGTTNNNGILEYEYTVPDEINTNKKLTFKGNRTKEDSVFIQILDDSVIVKGHVHDTYGNPLKNAEVKIDDVTVYTLADGSFSFTKMKSGSKTVTVSKDKYKTITEQINLIPGEKTLIYNLERIVSKPKITRAYFGNIGNINNKIIVPEGLQIKDRILFWTNVRTDMEDITYKADAVGVDGTVRELVMDGYVFDFSQLKAGDTLRVYVVRDGDVSSDPYVMQVEVQKAPFVHLLNSMGASAYSGRMNSRISFAKLFGTMRDKQGTYDYWLSGDALLKWNDIFDKFKSSFSIDVDGYNLESNTELVIDWFKYKNFTVYVDYNFRTGKFIISPYNSGGKYDVDYYYSNYSSMKVAEYTSDGSRTGSFRVNEVIDEDVRRATGYRYSSLIAYNNLTWDLESMFNVQFTFDNNAWNGEFELSVDEDNRFYGYYARRLPNWEKIGPWYYPETLSGTWYKSMTADNDITIPLTSDDTNADKFILRYNSNTNGGWYTGLGNIVLSSAANNTISLYPEPKLAGVTQLSGGYYILGYWYNLFAQENVTSFYQIPRNEDMYKSLSILEDGAPSLDTELEPVSTFALQRSAQIPDELEGGVFANAEIGIAETEKPFMVYLATDEKRENSADSSMVVIREYSNDTHEWGKPVVIENDGTGDYNPAVASISDGAVIVWADSESKMPVAGKLSVANIQADIASKLGISATVYKNGELSEVTKLDGTDCLNYSPVVSSIGDGAIAVWIENADNMMTEENRKDSLVYSVYDGNSWTEAQYISDVFKQRGAISDLTVAEENGTAYFVFAVTEEREYPKDSKEQNSGEEAETVTEKLKKFYMLSFNGTDWSSVKILNDSALPDEFASFAVVPVIEEDEKGNKIERKELQLIAISGNMMYRYVAATREIVEKTTIDDSLAAASEFTTAYDGEHVALAWVASENEQGSEIGQKIYTSLYDKQKETWTLPVESKAIDVKYVAKNINAAFADGTLDLVYNLYEYRETDGSLKNVSLCASDQKLDYDLEVEEVSLIDTTVMSGNDAKFKVKIKNKGLKEVEDFSITLQSSTGTSHTEGGYSIEGGESSEFELKLNVGEFNDNIKVKAIVEVQNDANSENNEAECDIVVANTEIGEITCTPTDEDKLLVSVEVRNTGMVDAKRKIKLYKGQDLIGEEEIEVKTGERKAIVFITDNPTETIKVKAVLDISEIKEISKDDKEKEITFEPNSKYTFGIIKPIAGKDELKLRSSAEVAAVENGEVQVNVELDNNEFKMMIPKEAGLEISAPGMIPRPVTIVPKNGESVTLFVGDVVKDEDNVIDTRDISVIVALNGYYKGSTGGDRDMLQKVLNIIGDINNDGKIDENDIMICDFIEDEGVEVIDGYDISAVIRNFAKDQETYKWADN